MENEVANNVLAAGLPLIQAKDAAMIEGKKIRHRFFMDDEYIYYKSGCWFTHHDCQLNKNKGGGMMVGWWCHSLAANYDIYVIQKIEPCCNALQHRKHTKVLIKEVQNEIKKEIT